MGVGYRSDIQLTSEKKSAARQWRRSGLFAKGGDRKAALAVHKYIDFNKIGQAHAKRLHGLQ